MILKRVCLVVSLTLVVGFAAAAPGSACSIQDSCLVHCTLGEFRCESRCQGQDACVAACLSSESFCMSLCDDLCNNAPINGSGASTIGQPAASNHRQVAPWQGHDHPDSCPR